MSTVILNEHGKRRLGGQGDVEEHIAKRQMIICPASPLVVQGMAKTEVVERLGKMFPKVPAGIIGSILKSCNYSPEGAAEALQRFSAQMSEDEMSASELFGGPPATSSTRAPLKRRFEDVQQANAAAEHAVAATSTPDHLTEWADRFVRSLQGAPSLDEARNRTRQALEVFEKEQVNKNSPGAERLTQLQHANQVLYKALSMTNQKNIELKQQVSESDQLRHALAEAQEQLRRAEANNQTLQWHLAQKHNQNGGGGFNQGPPGVF